MEHHVKLCDVMVCWDKTRNSHVPICIGSNTVYEGRYKGHLAAFKFFATASHEVFPELGGLGSNSNNVKHVDDDDDYTCFWDENGELVSETARMPHMQKLYNASELRRVDAEVSMAYHLRHPNVLRVYGAYIDAATHNFFAVEELCTHSLRHALDNPTCTYDPFAVTLHVTHGLCYLHAKGIVHGSINPSNVLIDTEGVAKLAMEAVMRTCYKHWQKDRALDVSCSAPYLAPETIHQHHLPVTGKADIYAFGILMNELFTRRKPYQPAEGQQLRAPALLQAVLDAGTRPSTLGCPSAVRTIIEACWASAPDTRPSVPEVLRMLLML
jgi:serine/threonine protein kinase